MTNVIFRHIANGLDRIGLRIFLAAAANIFYAFRRGPKRHFSVTSRGLWVNRQERGTIVSPTIHTASLDAVERNALDLWTWQYRPAPGDIVVDVGAGVGEETLVFAEMVGDRGLVVSIEASPLTFVSLEETTARSFAANVQSLCIAITDNDGTARISDSADYKANSLFSDVGSVVVQTRSLDSLASEMDWGPIALLKMNIEGAERLAIRGMTALASRVGHVVISCHDFIADDRGGDEFRTFDEVRAALNQMGFETTVRSDPRPWVRYYIYGRNRVLTGRPLN